YFSPKLYQKFVNNIPAAEVVDAFDIFREIRMVKTPEEVAIMEQAVRALEIALENSLVCWLSMHPVDTYPLF
ncbi:unnamed protein product, partial [marine sediment metagenome]